MISKRGDTISSSNTFHYVSNLRAGRTPSTFHEIRSMADKLTKDAGYDLSASSSSGVILHVPCNNSEMIHCLETVLRPNTTGVEERLARLRELRSRIQCDQFDAEEINTAIDRGRP